MYKRYCIFTQSEKHLELIEDKALSLGYERHEQFERHIEEGYEMFNCYADGFFDINMGDYKEYKISTDDFLKLSKDEVLIIQDETKEVNLTEIEILVSINNGINQILNLLKNS